MIEEFQWLSFETTTPQPHVELGGERFESSYGEHHNAGGAGNTRKKLDYSTLSVLTVIFRGFPAIKNLGSFR